MPTITKNYYVDNLKELPMDDLYIENRQYKKIPRLAFRELMSRMFIVSWEQAAMYLHKMCGIDVGVAKRMVVEFCKNFRDAWILKTDVGVVWICQSKDMLENFSKFYSTVISSAFAPALLVLPQSEFFEVTMDKFFPVQFCANGKSVDCGYAATQSDLFALRDFARTKIESKTSTDLSSRYIGKRLKFLTLEESVFDTLPTDSLLTNLFKTGVTHVFKIHPQFRLAEPCCTIPPENAFGVAA